LKAELCGVEKVRPLEYDIDFNGDSIIATGTSIRWLESDTFDTLLIGIVGSIEEFEVVSLFLDHFLFDISELHIFLSCCIPANKLLQSIGRSNAV
jgi:hypothetical protein